MIKNRLLILFTGVFLTSMNIQAEDLSPVSVFGSQDETQQAGSAHYITDEEMKRFNYTDPERILSRIPGVYSQTEDGYGLRTNIGMRGVAPLRTQKVNILEDGVLQGPATYANFAMYFFPDTGRMQGVEVLKGPAAIGTGPRTTAGTINFISRQVPTTESEGHYSLTFGDDGWARNHTYYGGQITPSISYVFEYQDTRADGFKKIGGTRNQGDTGFDKQSDLFKLRYTPMGSKWNQYFEISSQNTSETSNESYLGLTSAAFAADPFQRYGASAYDQMDNDYHRYIFSHFMQPTNSMTINSKIYKTRYSRLWGKVGEMKVDDDGLAGSTLSTVKFSKIDMNGNCGADSGIELRACNIITGTTDMVTGEYIKRSMGQRDYGSYGLQFVIDQEVGNHNIQYGYRYHYDYRQRMDKNYYERYTINGSNDMTWSLSNRDPQDYAERKNAMAHSYHIKDVITHGAFTTTLGLRHEDLDYEKGTKINHKSTGTNSNSETMFGASTIMNLGGGASVFGGYHEGYSPTGYSSAEPEKSDNFELGYRKSTNNSFTEVVLFYVDYDNLLESCLVANGCTGNTGDSQNAGKAQVSGVEFQYRLSNLFPAPMMKGEVSSRSGIKYPLLITGMIQESEYKTNTDDETSQKGKSIKYLPDMQLYVSMGMETPMWDISLGAKYHDNTFTNASNTLTTGNAFIFDLHSGMKTNIGVAGIKDARLFINVDNLFDDVFVASEHEYGKRPNKPRTFMAGLKFDF